MILRLKEINYTIVDIIKGNCDSIFEHLVSVNLAYVVKGHGLFPGIYIDMKNTRSTQGAASRVLYFDDYSLMEQEMLYYIPNISFVLRFFNITGRGGFFLKEVMCYVQVRQLYVDATQVTVDFTFVTAKGLRALVFKFLLKEPLMAYINVGFGNLKRMLQCGVS
ncbi:hypothetical protein B0A67_15705 [Flavobacterium aquidurense]|uniref:hypothetical protein n=1 Tax=Flavobacterium aquidurense TaxID=362413 RepID=UPI0009199BCF|nr:hypothetical protein [Flavobacterium aquidurense]OXA70460.1 hypothetical protein B0A67_15705 [Flavobacterium aquidurense]SHH73076.1 hypothetical protein SAMN05444481_12536 [Flavobacterium frigidimaris]